MCPYKRSMTSRSILLILLTGLSFASVHALTEEQKAVAADARQRLACATTAHPEMAKVNSILSVARANLQQARISEDPRAISLAQAYMTRAKFLLLRRASQIDDLKILVENWKRASHGLPLVEEPPSLAGLGPADRREKIFLHN